MLLFKTNNPKHCYTKIVNNKITEFKEKQIVGNHALVGIYVFRNKHLLLKYISNMDLTQKLYLSDLLNIFLSNNIDITYKISDLIYPFKDDKHINYIKNNILLYPKNITIGLSCDHSGYTSKLQMMKYLENKNIKYIDYGCYMNDDCDYYDYVKNQYNGFKNNEFTFGFSFCRSAQGVNIAANHVGFYSALIYDIWSAQMAIQHNNSNFFCLSDRLIQNNTYTIKDIIEIIINNKFLGGRFMDRLLKLN